MSAPGPGKAPCSSCPYRRDVSSGIWHASEYAKLPAYDGETMEQLAKGGTALFFCHQQNGRLCAGWVGCHDMRHAIACRLHEVASKTFDYVSPVPLFRSGAAAAKHGMRGMQAPDEKALKVIARLVAKKAKRGAR